MKAYSTVQVSRIIGVHKNTLKRWLRDGKISEPRNVGNGGIKLRLWTDRDVERARKYKQENYRKGRGRKPKSKR
jgi:DNA-binding transcriptional MerR regulator